VRAAVFYEAGDMRVEEKPKPEIGECEALIEVRATGVCGTDIHIYKGEWSVPAPLILGHEFSGVVFEVGREVTKFEVGDRVVAEPNITCGKCRFCLMSERNYFCENLEAIGVTRDGAFAEYVRVPEGNLYKVPSGISYEEAALIEPLACCIRGIDRAGIRVGDVVAIIGAGPVGLLLLQLAKASGASTVIQTDLVEERLRLAERLGADRTVNVGREDPAEAVMALTDGYGVDVAIEAVGRPETITQAINLTRRGGRLNIFGVAPQDALWSVKPFELYDKELTITTSYRSPFTFQRAVRLAASGRIVLKPLVTHTFQLSQIDRAFEVAERKIEGAIKVIVKP